MVSTKPYLIRAIHEWCVDQGFTPYLAVRVDEHTRVPAAYVRDGQIVLNVGLEATHQLVMDNEQVTFQARFNGVAHNLLVPMENIAAIYARENGQGMAFEPQADAPTEASAGTGKATGAPPSPDDDHPPPPPPRGSHLKIVK
ncbi:MAG: ClpXP protease specificity-enhancing factor [Azoarcus sp.]|jgi:stringent starvation protein B|nr:ClpXP protease specificity-enhancing factor [Azoarcus sp.]